MSRKSLNLELRTETGKNTCRRMRKAGFIPAIIYSHGETESIKVPKKDFLNLFEGAISESVIFDLKITNKKKDSDGMAFVKDFQIDPVSGEILHIDFFKVTAGEKIHTHVPIEFIGTSKGVKTGGVLEISERMLEIECLPRDLPPKIEVDITELEVGDSIHVGDIQLDEKIHMLSNPETVIVAVHVVKAVKVEAEVEEAEVLEEEEVEKAESKESAEAEKK